MNKISYAISTNRDISNSEMINSILSLPDHEKEIIICCPSNVIEKNSAVKQAKVILDDLAQGSVYGFNKATSRSTGKYISMLVDDIVLPENFLDILDFMQSDFIQQKIFKVSNIMWDGGPGLVNVGHDDIKDEDKVIWPIGMYHEVRNELCPYNVIPMPFFERKTVLEKLDSHILHPAFKHSRCDHWLGFYLSKNETFEPHKWRCPSIKYRMEKNAKPPGPKHWQWEQHDISVLEILTDNFIKGETPYIWTQ